MIHKELDMNRYNESGKKFIKTWLANNEIIGVRYVNRGRFEDELFYRDSDGKIRVALIPQKHVTSEAVFYGDLVHYYKTQFTNVYGYRYYKICYWYDWRSMKRIERVVNAMLAA